MPEDSLRHHTLKTFGTPRWKGRIFSHSHSSPERQVTDKLQRDEDVADFLRPSSQPTPPPPPPPPGLFTTPGGPTLTRIDTASAQRWPIADEINPKHGHAVGLGQASRGLSPARRKKGLRVSFTNNEPDIIGEGGDEADSPPVEVRRSRARSLPAQPSRGGRADGQKLSAFAFENEQSRPNFGRPPSYLPRADQVVPETPIEPPSIRTQAPEISPQLQLSPGHAAGDVAAESMAVLDLGPGRIPTPDERARTQASMRAEEGQALHHARSQDWSDDVAVPARAVFEAVQPSARPLLTPAILAPGRPLASLAYSLHPTTSPSDARGYFAPCYTSPVVGSGTPGATSVVCRPEPFAYPSAGSVLHPPPRKPVLRSWRSAASAVGADAVQQFASRVEHLNRVFQLAAETVKPIHGASVSQWMHACLWWFIRGRTELEAAIRSRPSTPTDAGRGDEITSRKLKQSYVDLAKARWILEHVTPEHPELRRHGNAAIASLLAIVKAHGDAQLGSLLELHQTIASKFRALTLSMKRNDFLPPDVDQPLLAQGLNTTIWVAYPALNPEIGRVLAGRDSRSLVRPASSTDRHFSDMMPLGDTADQFDYGRMFVDVSLADDDNPSPNLNLPCLVSVVRGTEEWQHKALIVSQNELVNVTIQSNKDVGPTWEKVEWNNRHNVLVVELASRGLSLHVRFDERDYKFLRGIDEHAKMVAASRRPGMDEELVFAESLETFRYLDANRPSPRFRDTPPHSCGVSIFEKRVSFAEGSGVRKLHRGHRLLVVTSPKVKQLNCINQVMGQEEVIRYELPRGTATTVALHVTKDRRQRTVLINFDRPDERVRFMSLLSRSFVRDEEMVLADVALSSLSIEGRAQTEALAQAGRDALTSLGWQRVRVVNKTSDDPDRAQSPTVLSANLRICAEGKCGSVTDHVNLGR